MKKLLLIFMGVMMLSANVYAAESYVTWHNSEDKAFTTDYDGILKFSENKKDKNGAIASNGKGTLTIKNLTVYDLMFTNNWTLELEGTSLVNTIEVSAKDSLTIKGNGVLKVKSIGLSMTDMTNSKDSNHKQVIDKYFKGNFSLGVSGDYIVITGLDAKRATTKTTKKTASTSTEKTNATTKKGETTTSTSTKEVPSKETTTSSTTTTISSSISTTTTKKRENKKEKSNNTAVFMAIGSVCAVALAGTLIFKLKNNNRFKG